jgi:WD40 repeat protein
MFDVHFGPVNAGRFSPNGQQIIPGADGMTVKLWDVTKAAEVMTFKGHTKKAMTVVFSLNSGLIVSGSEDMTVEICDETIAALLHTLTDHTSGLNCVAFSPNSQLLASCSIDDEVRLWNTKIWTLRRKLDNFEDDADYVVPPSLDVRL